MKETDRMETSSGSVASASGLPLSSEDPRGLATFCVAWLNRPIMVEGRQAFEAWRTASQVKYKRVGGRPQVMASRAGVMSGAGVRAWGDADHSTIR